MPQWGRDRLCSVQVDGNRLAALGHLPQHRVSALGGNVAPWLPRRRLGEWSLRREELEKADRCVQVECGEIGDILPRGHHVL